MALISTAFQVNTSAAQIWPPAAGPQASVRRVSIHNAGPNAIYIGAAGITTATGFKIPTNSTFTLDDETSVNGPIFAIADVALQVSPADTRIVVETAL